VRAGEGSGVRAGEGSGVRERGGEARVVLVEAKNRLYNLNTPFS